MVKLLLAASAAFFVSGCYQVADHGDIQAAVDFCDTRGGVNHISVFFAGDAKILCQNGETQFVRDVIQQRARQNIPSKGLL